jgi:LacI family transcriptional regulator
MKIVGLLVESSRGYGRGLLRGVARYVRAHRGWSIVHQERALADAPPPWLRAGLCDGLIARIERASALDLILKHRIPAVDLRGLYVSGSIPCIIVDDTLVAKMAADHLLERGFRHFAFCGFAGAEYSVRRHQAFRHYLGERGHCSHEYQWRAAMRKSHTSEVEASALMHERELSQWLANLPRPCGIMACNDICGRQVLNACRVRQIPVPEEIAVIGVDDDEVLCELADPPLTSIALPTEKIGFSAAGILDGMMNGKPPESMLTLMPPLSVIRRLSTDIVALEDRVVARAIRFIRNHAAQGITVEDVLDHLAGQALRVSRSTLERRFTETLGRSPKDEILNERVKRARDLLLDTNYSIGKIATMVGMSRAEQLISIFKSHTGTTPGALRKTLST